MSARKMHAQSLRWTQALSSHSFLWQVGTSVLLRNQSRDTATPTGGYQSADVLPRHTENYLPRLRTALLGGQEGIEHGHTEWSQVVELPHTGCLGGHPWLGASRQGCLGLACSPFAAAQHMRLWPLRASGGPGGDGTLERRERVRGMGSVHPLASSG